MLIFQKSLLGVAREPLGAPRDSRGPMGPHINYREERANARDEREVPIRGGIGGEGRKGRDRSRPLFTSPRFGNS